MRYVLIIPVFSIITILAMALISSQQSAYAQPYGAGIYNSNVPYGSETYLSISTVSTASLSVSPSTSGTLVKVPRVVTVVSTDVVGYKLYIRAVGSAAMTGSLGSIPASSNVIAAPLAVNTWGYNTTGFTSTDFSGVTTSDVLIKSRTGPYPAGDGTTVTFGLNVDQSKAAGKYSSTIMYTAVPQTN